MKPNEVCPAEKRLCLMKNGETEPRHMIYWGDKVYGDTAKVEILKQFRTDGLLFDDASNHLDGICESQCGARDQCRGFHESQL